MMQLPSVMPLLAFIVAVLLATAVSADRMSEQAAARKPYWEPLELLAEVKTGCQATSGEDFHLDSANCSEPELQFTTSKVKELIEAGLLAGGAGAAALRGSMALVKGMKNCSTVQSCGYYWAFMAMLFGAPTGRYFESEDRRWAWERLWYMFVAKIVCLRTTQLKSSKLLSQQGRQDSLAKDKGYASPAADVDAVTGIVDNLVKAVPESLSSISPFGGPGERSNPEEHQATLLLSGHSPGFFELLHVKPFIDQFRCYAAHRNMRFVADGAEQPLRHVTLAVSGNHFWAARWLRPFEAQVTAKQEEILRRLVSDLLSGHLGRAGELANLEGILSVYFDNPEKQTKIWSIAKYLQNSSMVIYLDADMTIRPDSVNHGLVQLLIEEELRSGRRPSDIYVRDSWPGIECLNSGFIALRNTRAARLFLKLWMEKIWWAVSWDQSALAETVLEMVGLEVQKLSGGKLGYKSQCVRYLFPIANGLVPYAMYCDCWQAVLGDLIGPYRQRRSRIIGFVNPERVDVNFVPSDLFVGHTFDLAKMHLVSEGKQKALEPLIVHWAGTGKMRLGIATKYLSLRFNTTMTLTGGTCSPTSRISQRSPRHMGRAYASKARAVRCCKRLQLAKEDGVLVTKEDLAYWGCCGWRPVTATECQDLLGS
eukprot:TRINITY_DN25422_c0_g2_i1.p1 TRINITY_DN25422_c0_g2~~TRINITY_DN25422_c0_g2_i1.p1  ORF type:complete len:651 (-),score=108.17 TRINITY_DN25422_c0_g2_i1:33-1985(-)